MQLEVKKHLEDIRRAAQLAMEFTSDKSFEDYSSSPFVRSDSPCVNLPVRHSWAVGVSDGGW